ncbi:siderophore-interacting protein [Paeniglutamicibacter cryotolerans]
MQCGTRVKERAFVSVGTTAKAVRPQVVLEVLAREQLSEHMVRLTFGGPGFADLRDKPATDRYVKILFAKPELGLVPPFDLDALREQLAPEDFPVRRTYTLRHVDPEAGTLQIDFVVHGDQGIAGPWAQNAELGDLLCFSGPGGMYTPDPSYDWHLLAGDDTAIPAIAEAIEAMAPETIGRVYIEVSGPGDEIELGAPAGVSVQWIHRGGPFTPDCTMLADEIRSGDWLEGNVKVFVHGEREVMKSLRGYFTEDRQVDRRELSLSAYWAFGRAEETFQAEKKTDIGKIFPEA